MRTESARGADGATKWGAEAMDLTAYLSRIGDDGELAPTVATLRRLHRRHVAAICFENLDAVLGRPIRLDLTSIVDKLVRRRRGGYCHEQNLLFAAVLERLGFPVRRLLTRVASPDGSPRPRAHSALFVEAGDQTWLADVGYGCDGLLEPIPLRGGWVSRQGGWRYQVQRIDDGWMLRTTCGAEWVDLYMVAAVDCQPPDFEMASHFLATHPSSPFSRQVIVQHATGEVRYALCGAELTVSRPDGSAERRPLSHDEFCAHVRAIVCLRPTNSDLARLWEAASG